MKPSKFNINNRYKTKLSFDYYPIPNDILNYYYLPLIGTDALGFYFFLITESKNFYTNEFFLKQERLVSMLNLTAEEIELAIKKLETIGLLKLYVDAKAKDKITYVLNEPLFPSNFIKNEKLSNLLRGKIGENNFYQNNHYFNNVKFKEGDDLNLLTTKCEIGDHQENHQLHGLQINYDFSVLFKILDSKNLDYESNWDDSFEEIIKDSILFYDLSTIDLVDIFENINKEYEITPLYFKKYLNDTRNKKNKNFDQLLVDQDDALNIKKQMLDTKSPGDFFRIIIGREMTTSEKDFFKGLINDSNYNAGMINRLIDYCNLANKGVINLNFLKKISKTMIKHKIDTTSKLEKHLKTANMMSERNAKTILPEVEEETPEDSLLNFGEIDFKL